MSSTRKAKDQSVFHQNQYASSPEFTRGLIANLVARRCSVLDDKSDRELIWFLQYLSHQPFGLKAVANDLIKDNPDLIQTKEMVKIGIKPGMKCDAFEVEKLRRGLPEFEREKLLLNNEVFFNGKYLPAKTGSNDWGASNEYFVSEEEVKSASRQPTWFPADVFFEICRRAVVGEVVDWLPKLCLNPEFQLNYALSYFQNFSDALRKYKDSYFKSKAEGTYITTLGQKVFDAIEYTEFAGGLTLIQGDARMGKSHAGRTWCEQRPGRARFVEVPPGNDDASFFRDLARGLGLGNFLSYKVVQIRERVEDVLRTGDLILVLDEAQRLFPQTNLREGYPKRIAWVMAMANAGVPICMISTPQFFATQKMVEKNGWNTAQLTGRISHYEPLPSELSQADLIGVAKAVLPEADKDVLLALAVYARSSARYLAAIDSISKRARFIAARAGRAQATAGDVRRAMKESVIPADTKLHRALSPVEKPKAIKVPYKESESGFRTSFPSAPDDASEVIPSGDERNRLETSRINQRAQPGDLIAKI